MINNISVAELAQELKKHPEVILLDVRTPAEFDAMHIAGSMNYPLNSLELTQFIKEHSNAKSPVFILCQKGGRARIACDLFQGKAVDVFHVAGGLEAWLSEKLPVVIGKKTMSLERQVRIIAGALILSGIILSFLGVAYAVWLSVLVSAGLIFSGITDTCGLALILLKMPWNKK